MQGFPRGDIDVPAIRADRQQVAGAVASFESARQGLYMLLEYTLLSFAVLTNDHKRVTSQIEQLMLELHAEARRAPAADVAKRPRVTEAHTSTALPLQTVSTAVPAMRPFALVDEVSSNSPAEEAGVAVGDQLIAFASVTGQTPNALPAVAAALQVCVSRSKLLPERLAIVANCEHSIKFSVWALHQALCMCAVWGLVIEQTS